MASTIGISSKLTNTLISRFRVAASDGAGSTSLTSSSSNSSTSLFSTLRLGARTYGSAIQGLNSLISITNLSESSLLQIEKITDKMIALADKASLSSTSSGLRQNLEVEFRKLVGQFSKVLDNSTLGEENYLTRDGLVALFQRIGLDEESSNGIADLFAKFVVIDEDTQFASEEVKGTRPVPPVATLVAVTTTSTINEGTFDTATSIGIGETAGNIQREDTDVNSDGHLDLLITSPASSAVTVLLGNGDGTFKGPTQTTPTATASVAIASGDFDRTGNDDFVVTTGTETQVMLSNGNGTFKVSVTLGSAGEALASGDFDGNGYTDIVIGEGGFSTSPTAHVYLNQGGMVFSDNGSFAGVANYAEQGSHVYSADIDSDGKLDLLLGHRSGSASILYGNGDGSFDAGVTVAALGSPVDIVWGDVDNDGRIDLIGRNATTTLEVVRQTAARTFSATQTITTPTTSSVTQMVDLNGDTFGDLVAHAQDNPSYSLVYLSNGDGTFLAPTSYPGGGNAISGAASWLFDLNEDGNADIVGLEQDGQNVTISLNGDLSITTTEERRPAYAEEFSTLFDTGKTLRNRADAVKLSVDLRALKVQIQDNLSNLQKGRELIQANIELVRGVGLAMLELSDQITSKDTAESVSSELAALIRRKAPGYLSQAENLDNITIAVLTLASQAPSS